MRYLLFLLLLLPLYAKDARQVRSVGDVKVWERAKNMWSGEPKSLYVTVINDSQYVYYYIAEPDPSLFATVGKRIEFSGTVRVAKVVDTVSFKYDTIEYFGSKKQVIKKELIVDTLYKRMLSIDSYDLRGR